MIVRFFTLLSTINKIEIIKIIIFQWFSPVLVEGVPTKGRAEEGPEAKTTLKEKFEATTTLKGQ